MKKYLVALVAFLLVMALAVTVYATETTENAPVEGVEETAGASPRPTEESAAGEEYASDNWFAEVKDFVAEHFSGLAVSLSALYMIIPKVGGVSLILKAVKALIALMSSLKLLLSDKENPDSVMNTLNRIGDKLCTFMADTAPTLEKLATALDTVQALIEELKTGKVTEEKVKNALLAVEEGEELMAQLFSDLISISTTIPHKTKAEMEEKWLVAKAHLHATVKEALNDGQSKETAA